MKTFLDTSSLIKLYHQEKEYIFLTSDKLLQTLFAEEQLKVL